MVMRDGSYIDDLYYAGGNSVTVKLLVGRDDAEWRTAHLSEMPREWLSEVRDAVDGALAQAS